MVQPAVIAEVFAEQAGEQFGGVGLYYYRLRKHARAGRAVQTTRGSWRAMRQGDGRPPGNPQHRLATPWTASLAVTVSDRPSVHGLARVCARRAAHAPWTWTWTITIRTS